MTVSAWEAQLLRGERALTAEDVSAKGILLYFAMGRKKVPDLNLAEFMFAFVSDFRPDIYTKGRAGSRYRP